MENKKKLTKADLAKVTGGSRYYGNGVNRLANFGHGNC